jgi:hypothetical protein
MLQERQQGERKGEHSVCGTTDTECSPWNLAPVLMLGQLLVESFVNFKKKAFNPGFVLAVLVAVIVVVVLLSCFCLCSLAQNNDDR